MQIVPANYYLSSLTNDVVNIIKMRTLDSHIRFIVNIDSNLPNALVGDETRVRQIMLNILNNAVKYTESGFVSLTVNGEITGEEELTLLVDVEDSGIGIHKDNIDKLFNHYYQVETTSVSEGVGLGLSITQSMLEAMDGNISVESTLGVGSKFTIQIPQKYRGAKKLAVVNDPTIQCIIYFERRMKYAESLMNTIINLGVACRLVNDAGFLHDIVSRETIHYVFLANTMFKAHIETLEKYFKPRQIVLLTDFGESTPPGQWNVISMPAHAISVANLFNGETSNYSYKNNEDRSTRFVAPNAKILIVDDIRTNLKIAGGLLLPYKTELDTCLSGYEALIAVEKKRYDVIFMDHRMPGMDGMEATKRIRDMTGEDGYFQSVPIIALTANAVSGMKELFMENGFSDFLSKPIDVPKLNELLEKWIPKEKQMNNYEKTPITPNPPKAKTELKDIAELDMAVGLQMVGDSMELYHLTLSSVVEEGRDIIPKIKEHISEANMPACTILFHALKGLMQTIGSKTLSVTAYELENAGSQGDTEYVTARVDDFLTSLEVLLADIEGAVETGESNQ
jgi:CheY-like chemotaxis protein/HPt (histidine-containing phosphotransfer) domain-containing protein